MKIFYIFPLLPLIISCAIGSTVYMKNPQTDEVVKCGGNVSWGNAPAANEINFAKLRSCINDYKEQGFIRTEKP